MNRRRVEGKAVSVVIAVFLALLVACIPLTHAALLSLTYDANGNLVTGDGKYRTYNSKNQLVSIRDGNNASAAVLQTYVHHPTQEKMLVKKTYWSNGTLKETVTYISDEFVRVVNSSGTYNTTYYFDGNADLIAQKNPDGTTTTLLNDIEGSANVATNVSGAVIERTTYEPFGAVQAGGTATRYTYEGKEADSVSGDIDFEFRKYNPNWGLFTQPDNIVQDAYDPQTLNRYAFERNNPYKNRDLNGHEWSGSGEMYRPNGQTGPDIGGLIDELNRVLGGAENAHTLYVDYDDPSIDVSVTVPIAPNSIEQDYPMDYPKIVYYFSGRPRKSLAVADCLCTTRNAFGTTVRQYNPGTDENNIPTPFVVVNFQSSHTSSPPTTTVIAPPVAGGRGGGGRSETNTPVVGGGTRPRSNSHVETIGGRPHQVTITPKSPKPKK